MKNLRLFSLTVLLSVLTLNNAGAEVINRVFAVVGDKVITQYDVESINPQRLKLIYTKFKGEERKQQLNDFYRENMENLIDNYVVEIAAAEEGVRVSDAEVEGALQDIMQRNNVNKEQLEELLAAQHQTYEQYKWKIKVDILTTRLMSSYFRPKVVVTDEDFKKYVMEHEKTLDLSDMYELRMMKLGSKEKLDEAMKDFEEHKSFRDTAMKYSEDKLAENGGYLGWVELGFLDPKIRELIGDMKQGITKPLEDVDGYRVFYVEGYKDKSDVESDKKENIIRAMKDAKAKSAFEQWLQDKKDEIFIQRKYAG
ncbi:SurA N-terminal domain-containing protein [Seleniivibrio sp.]|uniref:SurA N-terminal domain-containing protein n=1 Tax=Seleniivibrio sp. TaxID=2898801 RepID=UPI0025D904D3|nr:SurA N-terminal domain-containing protein [Seleniivibrio sp.]MCD8553749.1 SurA N-terminal domain-containing protein [Seleniivibrio sp.]